MEASLWFCFVPVLLLVVTSPSLGQNKPVFFKEGGELLLMPENAPETITVLTWKFESKTRWLVADWSKDNSTPNIYPKFKDRVKLNVTTGELHISGMKSSEEGIFLVEINDVEQDVKFDAKLMKALSKPQILTKPLSCSSESTACTLTCSVSTSGAEPVTYAWSLDDEPWKEAQSDLPIINHKANASATATANAKSYRCRVKNHVSQQDSDPHQDPFSRAKVEPDNQGPVAGAIFGVLFLVAAVTGFLLYFFRQREPIRRCLSLLPCVKGNAENQPTNRNAAAKTEMEGLNNGESNDLELASES